MKAGWQEKKLGDICAFVRGPFGGSLKKSIFVKDGFAVYEQQHAIYDQFNELRYFVDETKFNEMKRFELRPNDLIMSCSGTMGCVAIVPDGIKQGIINQALLKLTPSKLISPKFLKYWMGSYGFQESLRENAGGAAIQNVAPVAILKDIRIPLPTITEQQRIVSILDEAFEGVATATANAKKNLANARELFESYLQSVFTNKREGWKEKQLGEVCDLIDCLHKTPIYVDVGFPMVRVTDVKTGFLNLTKARQVDEGTFKEFSKKHLPKLGDIVFSRVGSYGVSSLVNSEESFCLGQNTVFILPKINSSLLYYFLNSPVAKAQFDGLVEGTTQPTISMKSIRLVKLIVPPTHTQGELVLKLDKLSSETKNLEAIYQQKLAALEELNKSILNQAFSGELN